MKRGDPGDSTRDFQSAGGVAKTTTAVILARSFASRGKKVLLIDTDSQGSIRTILGLKPEFHLADFLIRNIAFRECVVTACPNVDVVCSNRDTTEAEVTLSNSPFRELTFERLFSEHEEAYDVVLIECSFDHAFATVRHGLRAAGAGSGGDGDVESARGGGGGECRRGAQSASSRRG